MPSGHKSGQFTAHRAPLPIDIAALALALGTDLESGLGAEDAAKRLCANGTNDLHTEPSMHPWRLALAQLQDPLVYLLYEAAVVLVGTSS